MQVSFAFPASLLFVSSTNRGGSGENVPFLGAPSAGWIYRSPKVVATKSQLIPKRGGKRKRLCECGSQAVVRIPKHVRMPGQQRRAGRLRLRKMSSVAL